MFTPIRLTGILLFGSAIAQAQSTDPGTVVTPHQHSASGQTDMPMPPPATSTSPGAGASPHQMAVTKMPAMGNAVHGADFVSQAAQSGMAEVELSKLAANKASDPKVRSFATDMVKDHTKANDELAMLAMRQNIPVAKALDPEHAAKVREIGQQNGKAFDQAYLQQMGVDHQHAVALFQQETGDSNSELASFAGKTLSTLQHHQEMVGALEKTTLGANAAQ